MCIRECHLLLRVNIFNKMYAYFFPEQECDPVTVLVCINLTVL